MSNSMIPRFSPTAQLAQALQAGKLPNSQVITEQAPSLMAATGRDCNWLGFNSAQSTPLVSKNKFFDPQEPRAALVQQALAELGLNV